MELDSDEGVWGHALFNVEECPLTIFYLYAEKKTDISDFPPSN